MTIYEYTLENIGRIKYGTRLHSGDKAYFSMAVAENLCGSHSRINLHAPTARNSLISQRAFFAVHAKGCYALYAQVQSSNIYK